MVTGLIIPASATAPIREIDTSQGNSIARAVDGFMEAVDIEPLGITVYVNEEGLLRHLPFNSRATFLWWYHVPWMRHRDRLVGDAVIVGMPDSDGADTEIPEDARRFIESRAQFRREQLMIDTDGWQIDSTVYDDLWEALADAMVFLNVFPGIADVRVVPVADEGAE